MTAMPHPGEIGAQVRHRLPPLNALTSFRFFAAIYVVVYHLVTALPVVRVPVVGPFLDSGSSGVPFFFILSGFILAYNYPEVGNRREFWILRFARIYPIYFFALLFGFSLLVLPASQLPSHMLLRWVMGATLLHAWYRPLAETFNGPGWTLSIEAFFYAAFPFLLAWMKRMTTLLFTLFCVLYILVLCLPFWVTFQPTDHTYYLEGGSLPLLYLPMFLIGVYAGLHYPKVAANKARWPLFAGAVVSPVLLCLSPGTLSPPLQKGLIVLSYTALIYGLASVRRGLLTNRWMILAGEISLSIYILQMPVIRLTKAVARRANLGTYETVFLVLPVLIGTSYLTYRFIELPARVAIRGRLTHRAVPLSRL